jgi:hypothetical protein
MTKPLELEAGYFHCIGVREIYSVCLVGVSAVHRPRIDPEDPWIRTDSKHRATRFAFVDIRELGSSAGY